MPNRKPTRVQILKAALALAETEGWNHWAFGPLADRMGVAVNDIRKHFADPNAIADAWFSGAMDAMLAEPPEGFADWPAKERLAFLMGRWFNTLAPHRRVTAEMLTAKLHPPHIHHWGPAVFHLSRQIQLMRDAALLRREGLRREIEEIGLTALFLLTLAVWCRDTSENQARTKHLMTRWLSRADRTMACLYRDRAKRGTVYRPADASAVG